MSFNLNSFSAKFSKGDFCSENTTQHFVLSLHAFQIRCPRPSKLLSIKAVMLYAPKGQRVIQTWSNFNRNHSSFLGKRRISVGIFQNYKISFPGGFMPPLSRFLISFNTNILILMGKYAQLQFLHYCLPKINEVLFSKMDTGEERWEENDVIPGRNF